MTQSSRGVPRSVRTAAYVRIPTDIDPADLDPVFSSTTHVSVTQPLHTEADFQQSPPGGPYRVAFTNLNGRGRGIDAVLTVDKDPGRLAVAHDNGFKGIVRATVLFVAGIVCLLLSLPQLGSVGGDAPVKALAVIGAVLAGLGLIGMFAIKSMRRGAATVVARIVFDEARRRVGQPVLADLQPTVAIPDHRAGTPRPASSADSVRLIDMARGDFVFMVVFAIACWIYGAVLIADHHHSGWACVGLGFAAVAAIAVSNRKSLVIDGTHLRYGIRMAPCAQITHARIARRTHANGGSNLTLELYGTDEAPMTTWQLPYNRAASLVPLERAAPVKEFLEAHGIGCAYE